MYLIVAVENGEVYCGYTNNLRRRFRQHNPVENDGYTRGKTWKLLAVRCFLDRYSALLAERQIKRSRYDKINWIRRERRRMRELGRRHGIKHKLA